MPGAVRSPKLFFPPHLGTTNFYTFFVLSLLHTSVPCKYPNNIGSVKTESNSSLCYIVLSYFTCLLLGSHILFYNLLSYVIHTLLLLLGTQFHIHTKRLVKLKAFSPYFKIAGIIIFKCMRHVGSNF